MRAMEAILRGEVEHAFHPGGGLHHAMPTHASGFCIYDDPALAIALARREGLRVLYVDLDVHHGDGVQAIHWHDPGVLTISFHESGRYLFPGSGFANELGEGAAAGTSINLPFEPFAGEASWLAWVRAIIVPAAAAFGPDIVVSQHGCDSHAWDPLAHLRVTTTAMGAAARLVDLIAHRHARGRWLATGGGGYDAYRVVPRAWAHVWLAAAHREAPPETPQGWRLRWQDEASRFGQAPLPATFDDLSNAGEPPDSRGSDADNVSSMRAATISTVVIPALLQEANHRGWWDPLAAPREQPRVDERHGDPVVLDSVTSEALDRLALAPGTIPPADPADGRAILAAALSEPAPVRPWIALAVDASTIVGVAMAASRTHGHPRALVALGVAPEYRRRGVGTRLLEAVVEQANGELDAIVTVADRDPIEPLDRTTRSAIARRMLLRAGFEVEIPPTLGAIDAGAIGARRR
jgi:GNAT superfamily N-acetyltransferase